MPPLFLLYTLYYIGRYLVLLLFCITAIVLARKIKPWGIVAVGAGYELISAFGGIISYAYSADALPLGEWFGSIAIIVITCLIIKWRRRNLPGKAEQQKDE